MPLVRVQVKSEFGLGKPHLYMEANNEDPKAVLDGVAVAGLVGILRQLGDLVEFAGEVFHGLQEQVMTTASRSHKVMVRLKQIEAALPSFEKAILTQTSHIHFAYTAGSEWHPSIRTEQNQFIYHDLPRFMMDAYEECRDPPQLHLLDKFDTRGPGSCLKRYSDPTFFKKTSTSGKISLEKVRSDKKAHKIKRKRSLVHSGEMIHGASISKLNSSLQLTSFSNEGASLSQTATADRMMKSDAGDSSNSYDSGTVSGYAGNVLKLGSSLQTKEQEFRESSSPSLMQYSDAADSVLPDEQSRIMDDKFQYAPEDQIDSSFSSHVTWDEKAEILKPKNQQDVREMTEIVQSRGLEDVREMVETVQLRTQLDVREMAEIVQPRTQKDVRDMEEIVEPRTQQDVREMAKIEQPRTQQDVSETSEIVQPRTQQDVREMAKIEQPRTQQDVSETSEIVQPETQKDVREIEEIAQPSSQQDMREMVEIVQPRTQQGGTEKAEMVEPGSQQGGREKVEMVESRNQQHDKFKDQEYKVPVPQSSLDPCETEGLYLINDEQMSTLANVGHPLESIYDRSVFDEIGSETDNYMDALNTIESESETDIDCQTKREVEPCASNIKCEVVDPMHDLLESSLGPDIPILDQSSEPLVSSDGFYHDQRLEDTMKVSSPDCPLVTDLHGKESSTLESDITDSFHPDSNSSLEDHSGIKLLNRIHETEKVSSSSHLSDKFWTNGGLLGLQPSKPPSWAVPNAACENSSKGEKRGPSDHAHVINGNAQEIKMDNFPKVAINIEKDSTSNKSSLHGDDRSSNGSSYAHMDNVVKRNVIAAAGIAFPAVPNVNGMHTQTIMEKDENSNQNSGLGHQLLVNGFHRKLTLIHDERFEAKSMNTDGAGKRNGYQDTVFETMYERTSTEQLASDSSSDSCPSPPLDHMKISFHPVCGFETSKLKLRFPDGSDGRGSNKDIFPSFQLAPEESIFVHEIGSESDDDTFCRSSPCMSDDCLSNHSKSNSELWESDDTPETTGKNLYDVHHMSQTESLSTSFELQGITKSGSTIADEGGNLNVKKGMDESLSGPSLDLPCFDIVNPVRSGRIKSQCSYSPTPAPPPLPPAQWCVSKTSLDVSDGQKDTSAHSKQVEPVCSQQAPNANKSNGKPKQVIVDGQKELNHIGNDKVMDSREDFLQQIRAKSFNLRRTVTEKPCTQTGPATHIKVTAILEKANSIRQAVGSDNGEDDDSWSDA
ncbi:protein SCAR3-like isoform X2 [Cucurbita maxima]|uniref:Protein SCAR n=1 Tax=Cucurbita maxima TaxID=3661 RepID=A0A6J1KH68_CUCMA|nr:protein SCAR3-like isoform X2 [Cucurbita maxima]